MYLERAKAYHEVSLRFADCAGVAGGYRAIRYFENIMFSNPALYQAALFLNKLEKNSLRISIIFD